MTVQVKRKDARQKIRKKRNPASSALTRKRIIEGVVGSIAEHGLSRTTLATVAKGIGLSQGIVVFHFKTKDGLLVETLKQLQTEYRDEWQAALDRAGSDPFQCLLELVAADFSPAICSQEKLSLWFAFWGESSAHPMYRDICDEIERARYDVMLASCRKLADCGMAIDPVLMANSIDGLTNGLWLQMNIYRQEFSRKDAVALALDHLKLLFPTQRQTIEDFASRRRHLWD